MKRKTGSLSGIPAKRSKVDRETVHLERSKSLREQAEPYWLTTARFQINALTSTWSLGSNRRIHDNHVQSLCRIFEEQGLQRDFVENRLLIACTKDEVQRMEAHLELTSHNISESEGNQSPWLSFDNWVSVVGTKAEIMAGQHRVEALKRYLRWTNSNCTSASDIEKDQSWWICDVYDKDRLPAHLAIKLRANRQGSVLPDSHGQVWMELATLSAADVTLFKGLNAQVQAEMLRALGLSGRVPFPIRRLMTLWKNRNWQAMVTRWCSTDLGRETFNVSLWEEMARHRIDAFWFDTCETVLKSVSMLKGGTSGLFRSDDWSILSRLLSPRSVNDVQNVFYPEAPANVLGFLDTKGHQYRRPKFLVGFDDRAYHLIYRNILENPDLRFPDIQTLFRSGRQLGKIISQVMIHVGQWLNLHPLQISERDNNKPQLWRDFIPAFQDEHSSDGSEKLALSLQREIFQFVHSRIDEFHTSIASVYLSKLPSDVQGEAYLERFIIPIWKDLLVTVHSVVGSRFQRSLAKFNAQCPASIFSPKTEMSLSRVLREAISRVPEIRFNPALGNFQALEILMARISPVVADWADQQGGTGRGNASHSGEMPIWSSKAVELEVVKEGRGTARPRFDEKTSQRRHPPPILSSTLQIPVLNERLDDESAIETSPENLQTSVTRICGSEKRNDFDLGRSSILKVLNS